MVIYKDKYIFYSVRTLICQQSPKLTLTGSDKGLVLTASANLITKIQLMSCVYSNPAVFLCTASDQN
jgi:hypothetical protein